MRLLPLLVALFLAGCGNGLDGGEPRTAKERFAGTCGSCHTLADAGTKGTFGPNLDELKPDRARVLEAIAQGPGGMPDGLLEGEAADEVGGYVAAVAGR
jgi:mono/diheme cytochrome c family protein